MHLLLQPSVTKALKGFALGSAVWMSFLVIVNFLAHRPSVQGYELVWHGEVAHAALCIPTLSIVLPASISLLALLGLLGAYRGRLLWISNERAELSERFAPGPLFDAVLTSKVGGGKIFKVAYIILFICGVAPWFGNTESLIEIATVFGVSTIMAVVYAAFMLTGWASLNPAPRIKRWMLARAKHRLGNQFDLLPSNEKESFRQQAAQAGLDVRDEKMQLAAVQDYNARRKQVELEASRLADNTAKVLLSPPKDRL